MQESEESEGFNKKRSHDGGVEQGRAKLGRKSSEEQPADSCSTPIEDVLGAVSPLPREYVPRRKFSALPPGQPTSIDTEMSENKAQVYAPVSSQSLCDVQPQAFIDRFEENVRKSPDAIAIILDDEKNTEWSYFRLDQKVNQVATYLQTEKNISENDIILLLLADKFYSIVLMLAVMKCNAIFVPISPRAGAEGKVEVERRLNEISRCQELHPEDFQELLSSSAVLCIIDNKVFPKLTIPKGFMVLSLDSLEKKLDLGCVTAPTRRPTNPHNIQYMAFTSGTTGDSKAVCIEGLGFDLAIESHVTALSLGPQTVGLQNHDVSWDASFMAAGMILAVGGKLRIVRNLKLMSEEQFLTVLEDSKVTIVIITPSQLAANKNAFIQAVHITQMIVMGELIDLRSINYILNRMNESRPEGSEPCKITFGYGMIETSIVATLFPYDGEHAYIGHPVNGLSARIFDPASGRLIDYREYVAETGLLEGELCFSGPMVAKGYFASDPELTQTRFHHWGSENILRTGDWVRVDTDGNLAVERRCDDKAKIKGVLVQLDEIEKTIARILAGMGVEPELLRVLPHRVIKFAEEEGFYHKYEFLFACLNRLPAGFDWQRFNYLMQHALPLNLSIKKVLAIDAIPMLDGGKADLAALGALVDQQPFIALLADSHLPNETDNTAICEQIKALWLSMLPQATAENLRLNDDFSLLGGDSFLCTAMIRELFAKVFKGHSDINVEQEIQQLFNFLSAYSHFELTINNLACILQECFFRHSKRYLASQLTLNLRGDKSNRSAGNIFFFPDLLGSVNAYQSARDQFDKAFPNHNLVGLILPESKSLVPCMDYIAFMYANLICNTQQDGPLYFVGFSTGAVIAYLTGVEIRRRSGRQRGVTLIQLDQISPAYINSLLATDFDWQQKYLQPAFSAAFPTLKLPEMLAGLSKNAMIAAACRVAKSKGHEDCDKIWKLLYAEANCQPPDSAGMNSTFFVSKVTRALWGDVLAASEPLKWNDPTITYNPATDSACSHQELLTDTKLVAAIINALQLATNKHAQANIFDMIDAGNCEAVASFAAEKIDDHPVYGLTALEFGILIPEPSVDMVSLLAAEPRFHSNPITYEVSPLHLTVLRQPINIELFAAVLTSRSADLMVSSKGRRGNFPIHDVVLHQDDDQAMFMLTQLIDSRGSDILGQCNELGYNAIWLACLTVREKMLRFMLQKMRQHQMSIERMRTILSAKAKLDITPLGIGIQMGLSVRLIEDLFFANGVDPNASCDSKERTALFYAAQYGPLDLLELVIKYGGKIGYHGSKRLASQIVGEQTRDSVMVRFRLKELESAARLAVTPVISLHDIVKAISSGDNSTLRQLLRKMDKPEAFKAENGDSPYHICVIFDRPKMITTIFESGKFPNLNGKNIFGNTAVFEAADRGELSGLTELIRYGACVKTSPSDNSLPLTAACKLGLFTAVEVLLRKTHEPGVANSRGDTCLHYAVDHHDSDLVKLVASKLPKNSVNARNKALGFTALHFACMYGDLEVVRVLLNYMADPTIEDNFGRTAREWVNNPAVSELFRVEFDSQGSQSEPVPPQICDVSGCPHDWSSPVPGQRATGGFEDRVDDSCPVASLESLGRFHSAP